jgi:hypothetical protein
MGSPRVVNIAVELLLTRIWDRTALETAGASKSIACLDVHLCGLYRASQFSRT